MNTETKTETKSFSGRVYECCHNIEFYYDVDSETLSEEDESRLTEEAEERSRLMITEGFWSGDLCRLLFSQDEEREIFGSWRILVD